METTFKVGRAWIVVQLPDPITSDQGHVTVKDGKAALVLVDSLMEKVRAGTKAMQINGPTGRETIQGTDALAIDTSAGPVYLRLAPRAELAALVSNFEEIKSALKDARAKELARQEPPREVGVWGETLQAQNAYSPFQMGEIVKDKKTGEFFKVSKPSKRYIKDDGWSFGLQAESGTIYYADLVPVSADEAAFAKIRDDDYQAFLAAKTAAQDEFNATFSQIFRDGSSDMTYGQPVGTIVENPSSRPNIYGTGEWVVIGQDRIWACRNNGMDGDDWSYNNVRTGGAGAIGRWIDDTDGKIADRLRVHGLLKA